MTKSLQPAAQAFDAVAPRFDTRFGPWQSVTAQREAVRNALTATFPAGGRILELGGGTGEDAAFLAQHGYKVLHTDPSPAMVARAQDKLAPLGSSSQVVAAEDLEAFAKDSASSGERFDGAFSNFAPLNCVAHLVPVARGLAQMLKPGAAAMLVLFGTFCPGEMIVEILRGRAGQALRRRRRGPVPARLGNNKFDVFYHRRAELVRAFAPWFELETTVGIGVAVPPSASEPWISNHPRLLAALKGFDEVAKRPLAPFADHVLYQFRRKAN